MDVDAEVGRHIPRISLGAWKRWHGLGDFGDDCFLCGARYEPIGSSSYRQKCCDPGAVTGDNGCCDTAGGTAGVLKSAMHGGQLDCSHKNAFSAAVHGVS